MDIWSLVVQTIGDGVSEVFKHPFDGLVMDACRPGVVLQQLNDGVENIGTTGYGCEEEFANSLFVGESLLFLKEEHRCCVCWTARLFQLRHVFLAVVHWHR